MRRFLYFSLTIVSLLALGCTAPKANTPAVLDPLTDAQSPRDHYVAGIENFGFVSKELWRGAKPDAVGLQSLSNMGVATIIDLQEDDESAQIPLRNPPIHYVRIRTSEWHCDQVDVQQVLETIRSSPRPIYIHCRAGRDRTGLAVAAYRLSHGFSADEAIRELDNFHVDFWWRDPIVARIRQLAEQRNAEGPAISTDHPVDIKRPNNLP